MSHPILVHAGIFVVMWMQCVCVLKFVLYMLFSGGVGCNTPAKLFKYDDAHTGACMPNAIKQGPKIQKASLKFVLIFCPILPRQMTLLVVSRQSTFSKKAPLDYFLEKISNGLP